MSDDKKMKIEITELEAELIVEMLTQLWSDGFDSEEANTLFDKLQKAKNEIITRAI